MANGIHMSNQIDPPQDNETSSAMNTSSEQPVSWKCFHIGEETFIMDGWVLLNLYFLVIINSLGFVLTILSNTYVLFGAFRNKRLRNSTRILAIVLALEGLFSAVFVQSFFLVMKLYVMADPRFPETSTYCVLVSFNAYGGQLSAGFSIATVLGITFERYIAVTHPAYYREGKTTILKVTALVLAVQPLNVVLRASFQWYRPFSTIFMAFETIVAYIITSFANVRIYLKLKKMSEWRGENSTTVAKHRKIMVTSFFVVATFLVCYLPLLIIYGMRLDDKVLVQLYIRPWCITLLFLSYSINAFVYGWRSGITTTKTTPAILDRDDDNNNSNN